jgi:hypothetical protein
MLSVDGDIVKSEPRRVGESVRFQYSAQKIALEAAAIGEIVADMVIRMLLFRTPPGIGLVIGKLRKHK